MQCKKNILTGTALLLGLLGSGSLLAEAPDLARAEEIVGGRCFLCHGLEGESASPIFPRLAGQHPRYTEDQLKQFNSRERNNDNAVMHTVASKLTELERHAVAEFIATLE